MRRTWQGRTVQFGGASDEFTSALDRHTPFPYDDLSSILLQDIHANLVDLLHYEDRNSMAFSIETRLPFLDYRLVDFAFSLPHSYKIRDAKTKLLLHPVARDVLPEKVYHRPDKMGFSTPGQYWFQRKESIERLDTLFRKTEHPPLRIYLR